MGLIKTLFGNSINKEVEVELKKALTNMGFNMPVNVISSPVYGSGNPKENIDRGLLGSGDVYSIVRRIAKTAAGIPLLVYKVKDEGALKDYDYLSKQHNHTTQALVHKQLLKTKALELVTSDNPLQQLLDNPNPLYTSAEHKEGVFMFRLLTGNTYLYAPLLELGPSAGQPGEMWLLPSQYTMPKVKQTWPKEVAGYVLNLGRPMELTAEDVIHIRYFNPNFSINGDELVGLSPLRAGSKLIDRQISETDFMVSAFQNSGISGIMAVEDGTDMDAPDFGKMKDDFYREGSGTRNARKILFTGGKWKYTQIGLGPVDMDVLNSEVRTFKKLCNLYGISDILFNNSDASTESNVIQMVKQLYTNAALPEVYAYRDAINSRITPSFNSKGVKYFVDCDISGIAELQEDMKKMADIYATLPVMNPSLISEAFGYGKSTDPNMDKWYIKTGYTDLESLNAVDPLPVVTPNGN